MSEKKFLIDNKKLMEEWAWNKNKSYDPKKLLIGSHKKVWWKCLNCNNSWETEVRVRASRNNRCPICARKKASVSKATPKSGKSLKDLFPSLSQEWNYKKNNGLLPENVNAGSQKGFGGFVIKDTNGKQV